MKRNREARNLTRCVTALCATMLGIVPRAPAAEDRSPTHVYDTTAFGRPLHVRTASLVRKHLLVSGTLDDEYGREVVVARLNPRTQDAVWRVQLTPNPDTASLRIATDKRHVYVLAAAQGIATMRVMDTRTGETRWTDTFEGFNGHVPRLQVANGHRIAVAVVKLKTDGSDYLPRTEIRAYDAATGRLRWSTQLGDSPVGDSTVREYVEVSNAMTRGNSLWINGVIRRRPTGWAVTDSSYADPFVSRYDLRTGNNVWHHRAIGPGSPQDIDDEPERHWPAALTVDGTTLLSVTLQANESTLGNSPIIRALDARTGRVRWIHEYEATLHDHFLVGIAHTGSRVVLGWSRREAASTYDAQIVTHDLRDGRVISSDRRDLRLLDLVQQGRLVVVRGEREDAQSSTENLIEAFDMRRPLTPVWTFTPSPLLSRYGGPLIVRHKTVQMFSSSHLYTFRPRD